MFRTIAIFVSLFVSAHQKQIFTLTPQDSTLILNSYRIFRNYSNEVEITSTGCTNCYIRVDGSQTDATFPIVTGSDGTTCQASRTVSVSEKIPPVPSYKDCYLLPPVKVNAKDSLNDYAVVFSLTDKNDVNERRFNHYAIYKWALNPLTLFMGNKFSGAIEAITIAQDVDSVATHFVVNAPTGLDSGCGITIYAQGSPHAQSKDKYRIVRIDSSNADQWVPSDFPITGTTLIIDQNCSAVIYLSNDRPAAELSPNVVEGNFGVDMSREYPGAFDEANIYDQWHNFYTNTVNYKICTYEIELKVVDPGDQGSFNMSVIENSKHRNDVRFDAYMSNLKFNWKGFQMGIDYHPGLKPRKGYLLSYKVSKQAGAASFLNVLIISFAFLLVRV